MRHIGEILTSSVPNSNDADGSAAMWATQIYSYTQSCLTEYGQTAGWPHLKIRSWWYHSSCGWYKTLERHRAYRNTAAPFNAHCRWTSNKWLAHSTQSMRLCLPCRWYLELDGLATIENKTQVLSNRSRGVGLELHYPQRNAPWDNLLARSLVYSRRTWERDDYKMHRKVPDTWDKRDKAG